jgi:uncharacterized YkwD family protein
MKKRIYQTLALLFTVSILTVSASAANLSNCGALKESSIWKYVMMVQNRCLQEYMEILGNKPIELPKAETPRAETPAACVPKTPAPAPEAPKTPTPAPEAPKAPVPEKPTPSVPKAPTPAPAPEAPKTPVPAPEQPEPAPIDNGNSKAILAYEAKVIELVNDIRKSNGLSTFATNVDLCQVARYKSQDMVDKNYFSHTSPTYGSPFDMMKQFGISYRTAGENIAYGYRTPESVVEGWMNSEGHRKNILNPSFTQIGVGYVSDGHYWTQMFIG